VSPEAECVPGPHLKGISIRKHFHRIYASRYHFNQHGEGTFANLVVTDTVLMLKEQCSLEAGA
jgi:hypothetical protein